jgi:hypothetical protein
MRFTIALFVIAAAAIPSKAIVVGQVDDFQDRTTQGWGFGANTTNVANGGPAGVGDAFLRLVSHGGIGSAGELGAANGDTRWRGDYIAAGVTGIAMDLQNTGAMELQIRLFWINNLGGWTSTVPFVLPPDGQWHTAVLGLSSNDLTAALPSQDWANSLQHMSSMGFRHQAGPPSIDPAPIAYSMNVDNIRPIPEPGPLITMLLATCLLRRGHSN